MLPFICLFVFACEPINNAKEEKEKKAAKGLSAESSINTPGDTQDTNNQSSNNEPYTNLTSALRIQHLNNIVRVFNTLHIMIDDEKCLVGQPLSITQPGEITDSALNKAFEDITEAIYQCMGTGAERVKIKAVDLADFEAKIKYALGHSILPACEQNNHCDRLPNGGFFQDGLGGIYSKKIQGLESQIIDSKLRSLMIDLADEDNTIIGDYRWITKALPNPVPVPRCVYNVCKGVTP